MVSVNASAGRVVEKCAKRHGIADGRENKTTIEEEGNAKTPHNRLANATSSRSMHLSAQAQANCGASPRFKRVKSERGALSLFGMKAVVLLRLSQRCDAYAMDPDF